MKLEDSINRKYEEVIDLSEWEIETDSGFQTLNSVSKTIPYEVWSLLLASGKSLKCADDHIVYTKYGECFVKHLQKGDEVETVDGYDKVVSVINLGYEETMYDVDINNEDKRFYANGILSHNSTILGLYSLWFGMFSEEPVNIFILANKARTAQSLLGDIKVTYEEIEPYLKRGIVEYNKTSVEFDNRSTITTAATTPDSIRGESVSFLLLDEFAHVRPHIAEDFYESAQPTISQGGKICVISTPKGNSGIFYDIFEGAKKGVNGFAPFEMDWTRVPRYNEKGILIPPEKFKELSVKDIGLQKWNQEYEARFLGSAKTLIDGNTLNKMKVVVDSKEPFSDHGHWLCYRKPEPKHLYVIGVDVSKGTENDSSCMQVIDITNPRAMKQVAVYDRNDIDPFDFTKEVFEMGRLYNNAYLIVENNTYGHEVCRRLHTDFQYEHLYKEYKKKEFGVTSSEKTKSLGTSYLKKEIEENCVQIFDNGTFQQLCDFIEVKPDVFKCPEGSRYHDDRVMALVWAIYFVNSDFWREWEGFIRQEVLGLSETENKNQPVQEIFQPLLFDNPEDNSVFGEEDSIW